jgi:predicted molibdopterin-dependent oxidoreductase YjgC
VVLPSAAWAEKDGCWENYQGKIQPFLAAVAPPSGTRREADVYYYILGRAGLYNAQAIRKEMGEPFAEVHVAEDAEIEPAPQFVAL